MLDVTAISRSDLQSEPYWWTEIGGLFDARGGRALAGSYPRDHFKTLSGHDGEKQFLYESRSLLHMGARRPSFASELSPAWQELAGDLVSPGYRAAMSLLTCRDLTAAPTDKIVTHVLYFNRAWDPADGGCLSILRSKDPADVAGTILPLVGNSSVLVRSDRSWHAVQPVAPGIRRSRRSVTVTFYRTGAVSTMWPPGDETPLHGYDPTGEDAD